jgi:AcrR family transcriptional regulator
MTIEKRPYRMKRRAELEARTRQRITESAVALHGTLGPARTSISAIAAYAGVRRATVYRHFPDEAALFTACTSHWTASNPAPDTGPWAAVEDPVERLHRALSELYGYYRRTEHMLENVLRDEESMPVITEMLGGYRAYLTVARETLLRGRRGRGAAGRHVRAAIGHALAFATWRSLTREQGLDDPQAAELMCRFVTAAADGCATS